MTLLSDGSSFTSSVVACLATADLQAVGRHKSSVRYRGQ